jgi:hypothetical protein
VRSESIAAVTSTDWETAAKAFDQSLEAARQVDENVNRLIAAVAFLALGGFALFFATEPRGQLRFAGTEVDAAEIFFFLFDCGVFFAVAFALRALDVANTERQLFFLESGSRERLAAGAAHFAAAARRKARLFAYSRASTEFAMISLALLGTARLPELSEQAKTWLIVSVLGAYGFGATWRHLDGSALRRRWSTTFGLYLSVSLLAALLLLLAFPLDAHWPALAFALGWIAVSRFLPDERRGEDGSAVGSAYAAGAMLVLGGAALVLMLVGG